MLPKIVSLQSPHIQTDSFSVTNVTKILGDHIENTAISILAQRQETDEEGLEQSKNPPLSIYTK